MRPARQVGALPPDAEVDPLLIVELLQPIAATGAAASFTYSRPWLRRLMAHFTEPRFAPAVRKLTPPPEYALVWRATLSAAGLFAQLGATVPTRGLHLAYSPGFRGRIPPAPAVASAAASRVDTLSGPAAASRCAARTEPVAALPAAPPGRARWSPART